MKRALSLLGVVLLVGSAWAIAQDEEAKPRRSPKGILPAYYGAVVAPDQRERIYAIQQNYAEQIQQLEDQLAALKAKRDKEVEAVLTPEQLAKVKALQDEAKARREAARKAREAQKAAAEDGSASQSASGAEAKPAEKAASARASGGE